MVFGFGGGKSSRDDEPVSEALKQASRAAARLIADSALSLARPSRRQYAPLSSHIDPTPELAERPMPVPRLTMQERMSLARSPKRDGRIGPVDVRDLGGKIWNAPNTLAGAAYGSLGHAVGSIGHAFTPNVPQPRIVVGENAVQFRDNPFGGVSAITIGNTSTYKHGVDTPGTIRHEKQHTYQGEELGPFYLPANVVGGVSALLHGQDWHGDRNFMERGPQMTPPRPWPRSRPR